MRNFGSKDVNEKSAVALAWSSDIASALRSLWVVRSNPAYVVYVVWKFNTICPMNSQVNCKAKVEKYVKEATMYGRKKLEQMSRKMPWRRGIVFIASTSRTEDPGFESRQVVRLLCLNPLRRCY
jgi:hypothetical protein